MNDIIKILYVENAKYKEVLLMKEMLKEVCKRGGFEVCEKGHEFMIKQTYKLYNGNILFQISELQGKISKIEQAICNNAKDTGNYKTRKKYLNETREKLKKLTQAKIESNAPICSRNFDSLSFVLSNKFYHVWFDENPFFDHHFIKEPIYENGLTLNNYYAQAMEINDILGDFLLDYDFSNTQNIASKIIDYLVSCKDCEQYFDYQKVRVPNLYDDGFHYETVKKNYNKKIYVRYDDWQESEQNERIKNEKI